MPLVNAQRMVTTSLWGAVFLLVVGASLVACTGRPKVGHSGFLGDYSQFKPHPEVKGAEIYENPSYSLKQYNKFIIDPVIAHFAPDEEGAAIDPDELKELTDYFEEQLVKGLSESGHYQVVSAPGPGVLRLRIAITGIEKTTAVANIHPAMKMSGIGLGGGAMEAEAVDSVSGDRVAAVVDAQSGGRMGLTAGWTKYGHAKQVMNGWVERFVKRLDKAHGYKGK